MRIHCSRLALSNALTAICRIVPTRVAQPILSGFMIFTREETLVIQATDTDIGLTVSIPAKVDIEGCTVVAGRHLTELVRRLPDGELTVQLIDDIQQLEVLYQQASVRINTWAPADFPSLPVLPIQNKIIISGVYWKNMLKKVIIASAQQEVRPNYAGVYIQLQKDQIKLVSTDTYRLALLVAPYNGENLDSAIFIPTRPLSEINRLLEDDHQLEIVWDQTTIGFQTNTFSLTSRLMDTQFPAYEKVIPKNYKLKITINKEIFIKTLERAALFNELPTQQAVVNLKVTDNILFISAEAAQVGSIKEEIPLISSEGEDSEALFTTRYLIDPLKVIDHDDIMLCLNGSKEPAVYLDNENESYLHLILPIRRLQDSVSRDDM